MVAGNICEVEGCTNILKKKDGRICWAHRNRMYRHGNYDISPNWPNLKKGQPCITRLGYVRINVDGKRMLEHRYVMEQHLGRPLTEDERIHHINGDKTDNRIENLELWPNHSEHMQEQHPDGWKRRTVGGEVPPEIVQQIADRVHMDGGTYDACFCGGTIMCRNLCTKHYQWAYRHGLFQPNLSQRHYDGIHHGAEPQPDIERNTA